jgi:hypothetical protein
LPLKSYAIATKTAAFGLPFFVVVEGSSNAA